MEAGRQLGLKSHSVLTVDDDVQLFPVCGCLYEEGVFSSSIAQWGTTFVLLLFLAYLFVTFDVWKSLLITGLIRRLCFWGGRKSRGGSAGTNPTTTLNKRVRWRCWHCCCNGCRPARPLKESGDTIWSVWPGVASNEACCDALCLSSPCCQCLSSGTGRRQRLCTPRGGGQGRCKPAICRQVGSAGDFCVESPRWSWPSSLWQWCGSPTSGCWTGEFLGRGCFGCAWGWSYSAGSRSWFWSLRWVCSTWTGWISCPSRLPISSWRRSFWRVWCSLKVFISRYRRQSSAKSRTWDLTLLRRSLMCRRKRRGPSTVPWGTQKTTEAVSEEEPSSITLIVLQVRNEVSGAEVQQYRSVTACEGAYGGEWYRKLLESLKWLHLLVSFCQRI